VGFVTPAQKNFDDAPIDFAPLVVPFYIFDGYPEEDVIRETIAREVE